MKQEIDREHLAAWVEESITGWAADMDVRGYTLQDVAHELVELAASFLVAAESFSLVGQTDPNMRDRIYTASQMLLDDMRQNMWEANIEEHGDGN